jgi:hypothetical protein
MDKLIAETLKDLGLEQTDENRNRLRLAFNQVKADDHLFDVREFQADDMRTRVIAKTSTGESVVLGSCDMPAIGDLVNHGNKNYYVASVLSDRGAVAAAVTDPKQTVRGSAATR